MPTRGSRSRGASGGAGPTPTPPSAMPSSTRRCGGSPGNVRRRMKLATFTTSHDAAPRAGEVRDDTIVAFDDGTTVLDRLRSGDRSPAAGESFALSNVKLLAPHIPRAI